MSVRKLSLVAADHHSYIGGEVTKQFDSSTKSNGRLATTMFLGAPCRHCRQPARHEWQSPGEHQWVLPSLCRSCKLLL